MNYYEPTNHVIQVKEGARRWLREILVCILLVTLVLSAFMLFTMSVPAHSSEPIVFMALAVSVWLGIQGGLILWVVYRILRFAVGR